jgi:hypothetical protein
VAGVPCMCTSSRGQVPGVGLLQAAEGFTVHSDCACFLQCRPCAAWSPFVTISESRNTDGHIGCALLRPALPHLCPPPPDVDPLRHLLETVDPLPEPHRARATLARLRVQ